MQQSAAQVFLETARQYQQHGTSYPERVKVLERIATHLKLSPDLLEQSPTLQNLMEQLDRQAS